MGHGLTWGEAELRMRKDGLLARRRPTPAGDGWNTWLCWRDGEAHWLLPQAILDECNDRAGQSRYLPHPTDIVARDWEVASVQ